MLFRLEMSATAGPPDCDRKSEQGNCPQVAALHIGISESMKNNFKMSKWQRASARYNFATIDARITWGAESACRPTLYDTGNSTINDRRGETACPGLCSKRTAPGTSATW